jgi:peptidoglycan pentaglycine glycine transferase (the first glycine)
VDAHPFGHPLQLWGWGEPKRAGNWTPHRLVLVDRTEWVGAAQLLVWPIPRTGRCIAYVPRGPVADPTGPHAQELLAELAVWSKARGALYLRIEPAWLDAALPGGWQQARHSLQMRETYTIDLTTPEADLLQTMGHKHRQYIRKSERDGVTIARSSGGAADLRSMFDIYTLTAQRAGFGIHTGEYYSQLSAQLGTHSYLYTATFERQTVAFLWLAAAGWTAYELYGGVNALGQQAKSNYLLKWRAITDMKSDGYRIYDFNGRFNEGVSRFKEGFGPVESNYIGTWDYPLNKLGYELWERLWPVASPIARRLLTRSHDVSPPAG